MKNNDWAVSNYRTCSKVHLDCICPEDFLEKRPWNSEEICFWLARYACETRSKNGSKYPASTVFALLAGLLRHMRAIDGSCPNVLDVGAERKRTPIISKEEESLL